MTLRTHRLPLIHFDALASGYGDLAGELATGQLSKRLIQILALLSQLSSRYAGTDVPYRFAESYHLIASLRRRSAAAVDDVLRYPQVGAWAAHTLGALSGSVRSGGDAVPDDDLGHFAAIAASAALAAGEGFELTLRVRADGTVMLPMFGLIRLGAGPAWRRAWAGSGSRSVCVDVDGTVVEIPVLAAPGNLAWSPLRRLASTVDGCGIDVILEDLDPYRDCHRLGAADRLSDAEFARWQAGFDQAWKTLVRQHNKRARSLSAGLANLVPLRPRAGIAEYSASSSLACGSVAVTPPRDGTMLALALIHEYQHSKLSALLDLVPLHDAGADEVFYAPWRPDPRPLAGLLQGTYAHLGLVDAWQVRRLVEVGGPSRLAHFEFARLVHAVRRALQTLGGCGQLTDSGARFVAGMRGRLAQLRALPVPRVPQLLARSALLDHWTSWRLHNLRPDQDQVGWWAHAWLSGAPRRPPDRPRPADVIPGRRWSGTGPRLELAYHRLRDPDAFEALCSDGEALAAGTPGAAPADVAYAGADYPTAARLYRHTLADAPDRIDAWAGLVLAHRQLRTAAGRSLTSYPESIRALHQRITQTTGVPPDVEALALWFGTGHRAA